jgi:hypothetical protein
MFTFTDSRERPISTAYRGAAARRTGSRSRASGDAATVSDGKLRSDDASVAALLGSLPVTKPVEVREVPSGTAVVVAAACGVRNEAPTLALPLPLLNRIRMP